MTLHEWDRSIAPVLSSIRAKADWAKYYASAALIRVRMLPSRPMWETNAQAELDAAIGEAEALLESLREARQRYDEVPIMLEAAE